MAIVENLDLAAGLIGEVTTLLHDAQTGALIEGKVHRNVVTDFARAALAQWLVGAMTNTGVGPGSIASPDRIALGTGTGTASSSDTALWGEAAGTRKTCAFRRQYAGYSGQFVTTWTTSDPLGTFTEAGLMDAAGNLWAHVALANVGKQSGQILTVQWSILFKNM